MMKTPFQEKQLKKVKAKQKRLQAILGGEDSQRVEAELLAEDDEEEGEVFFNLGFLFSVLTESIVHSFMMWGVNIESHKAKKVLAPFPASYR